MQKAPWLVLVRVAALVALAASAALLSDYTSDAPTFCSAASGCVVVRASALGHIALGDGTFVPLPLFGVLGFAALYAASLLSRRATQLLALIGGAAAAYLLYSQAFVIHHFCWLCVTTDVAAVVAAVAALRLGPDVWREQASSRLSPWAWWAWGALVIAAPLTWPKVKLGAAVPSAVQALYRPGKINVVEFADFECPACRRFAGNLKQALSPYGERVHFVRLNKPLAMHAHSRDAARAAICAENQQRADQMAEALFATDDLSPAGIDALVAALGLDSKLFESCRVDAATEARVERESSMLVPPELEGLPTTYIGNKRLLGVQSVETVTDALERAARGEGAKGISGFVYVPIISMLALLVLRLGWRRSPLL